MLVETQPTKTLDDPIPLAPVVRECSADLETPVSTYLKLAGAGPSFLLESVTGGEQVARYSFIGIDPSQAFVLRGTSLERHTPAGIQVTPLPPSADVIDVLRAELAGYAQQPQPGLPRFTGGLAGYLGYDTIHQFEPTVPLTPPGEGDGTYANLPQAIFLLADTLVAFDHAFGRLLLITNARLNDERALQAAESRLDALQERIQRPLPAYTPPASSLPPAPLHSNLSHDRFLQGVMQAKEHIAAGDIFQVVLSQRFSRETSAHPFDIYRALRRLNPSPYMFFFDFAGLGGDEPLHLIGASPEMHVRLEAGCASMRPIAGTRPRGRTPDEDSTLETDLLADEKERAEHVMLVDLARNDLGRVCEYGSVHVPELMGVERYSHVMHIVSQVEGRLRPEFDSFDLLRATFPAGTVSGAPKIRAMQIIGDLETGRRGPYAGIAGYFAYDGSLDTCIAIRTLVMQGRTVHLQAGAGIVADSDPESEYQETLNKARALAVAVEITEGQGTNSNPRRQA